VRADEPGVVGVQDAESPRLRDIVASDRLAAVRGLISDPDGRDFIALDPSPDGAIGYIAKPRELIDGNKRV